MKRGDAEAAARVIADAEGVHFPPRSECTFEQARQLREFIARAQKALPSVQCALLGKDCTCWTNEELLVAARREKEGVLGARAERRIVEDLERGEASRPASRRPGAGEERGR